MTHSLEHPQLTPSDHVLMVLADYGPDGGGWGPAAWVNPATNTLGPLVYTGDAPGALTLANDVAAAIARNQGIAARVVRFTAREDLAVYEP